MHGTKVGAAAAVAGVAAVLNAPLATLASTRAYAHLFGHPVPEPPAALAGLLTFSDPATVYATFGRAWVPVAIAFLAGAWAVRSTWGRGLPRSGRVGCGLLVGGLALQVAGNVGDYWLGEAALGKLLHGASFAFTMLGVILASAGGALAGVAMWRHRVGPRVAALALVALPVGFPVNALVPNMPAAAMLVAGVVWILVGVGLARASPRHGGTAPP